MLADRNLKQIRKDSVREVGTLLFDPEAFKDDEFDLTFDSHKLDQQQLHEYALAATKMRRCLSARAAEILGEPANSTGTPRESVQE